MSLDQYLRNIRKYVPMSKKEEKEWFQKAKAGDKKAFEHIICSNLRFVVSVAKKYQHQGLDLEDLIAEGNIGLLKAYEKFDPDRNYKFITYAGWWIRQTILLAIKENSRNIKIPLNKICNITKYSKLKEQLEQEFARPLCFSELEEYIDDPNILNDIKHEYIQIEIDKPNTDNEKNLTEILANTDDNVLKNIEICKDEIDLIFSNFTKKEKEIIYMYFGIEQIRPYTLNEIGIDMGLTRERIRQIKEKILEKLRENGKIDDLRNYLE